MPVYLKRHHLASVTFDDLLETVNKIEARSKRNNGVLDERLIAALREFIDRADDDKKITADEADAIVKMLELATEQVKNSPVQQEKKDVNHAYKQTLLLQKFAHAETRVFLETAASYVHEQLAVIDEQMRIIKEHQGRSAVPTVQGLRIMLKDVQEDGVLDKEEARLILIQAQTVFDACATTPDAALAQTAL